MKTFERSLKMSCSHCYTVIEIDAFNVSMAVRFARGELCGCWLANQRMRPELKVLK